MLLSFLKTTFRGIRNYLPAPDSVIFLTESISLKNQDYTSNLRALARRFQNVIPEHEIRLLI